MAKAPKEKEVSKKPRLSVPMFKNARLQVWKIFLIAAIVIPTIITIFYWSQAGFEGKKLFDRIASDRIIFSSLIGFGGLSLVVQYFLLPKEKRKREIIRKTPILIIMGIGVAVVMLILVWLRNPNTHVKSMISDILHKHLVVAASVGFILEGIIIAFLLSLNNEQKKFMKALLLPLAAIFTFGGPTYMLYVLRKFRLPTFPFLLLLGFVFFVSGIILFAYLLGEKGKGEASP
jgi:hypothetical protein